MLSTLTTSIAILMIVILIRILGDSAKAARFVLFLEAICVAFFNPSFYIYGTPLYSSVIILYFGMLGLLWPFKGNISKGMFVLLFLWVYWILISLMLNQNITISVLRSGLLWGFPLAGFVIGYAATSQKHIDFFSVVKLWYKLVVISAIGVSLTLARYFFSLPLSWIPLRFRGLDPGGIVRIAGVGAGANPNPFADYILISFFTSLGLFTIFKKKFHQILIGLSLILFSVGLIMANSRGAVLGCIVGGTTWLVWSIINTSSRRFLLRIFIIAVSVKLVFSSSEKISTYVHVLIERIVWTFPRAIDEVLALRCEYHYYWLTFVDSPFWGKGLGWFRNYPYIPRSAHNVYLQLLSEGGILAFSVGLLVFLIIMRQYLCSIAFPSQRFPYIQQLRVLWLAYGSAFIGILIHGLFENTLTQIQTGWLIGALLGSLWNK